VILAVLLYTGYEFGYKAARARDQEWQGTIAEKSRQRIWWKGFKKPLEGNQYRYYDYFWNVRCDDESVVEVEVLYGLWNRSKVGDPVRKSKGERWPVIDTPEAEKNRELTDEILKNVF